MAHVTSRIASVVLEALGIVRGTCLFYPLPLAGCELEPFGAAGPPGNVAWYLAL